MTSDDMKEEGWMIISDVGLYWGSFFGTRKEAIARHVGWIGDDWKKCYRRGDRAVRVLIQPLWFGDVPPHLKK